MTDRNRALDAFRGAAVALMILVNNPGSWAHLYPPLAHARWHGCTLTDLVFPFFLFAVGNAMAFSFGDDPRAVPLRRIVRRAAWLFGIGLFLNAAPFVRWNEAGELVWRELGQLRWLGVLQRIALCYALAALALRRVDARQHARVLPAVVGAGLVGYWALCLAFGAPGDPWSLEGWFGTALDRQLLGEAHLYRGEGVPFDPEGLASTLPAAMQVLIGYWVGRALRAEPTRPGLHWRIAGIGLALLAVGFAWSLTMPLNKKIWTSSYVLLTSGWACLVLAAMVHVLDVRRVAGRAADLLLAFGSNALFVFVLSGFLPRVLSLFRWPTDAGTYTTPLKWLHDGLIAPVLATVSSDPRMASLANALVMVAAYAAVAVALQRRGIVVKV